MTAPDARFTMSTRATHAAWFDHAVQMAGGPVEDPRQLLAGWELADATAEFLRRHRTNRLETRRAPGRRLAASGQPPVTCTADVLARMGDFLGVVSVTR
jgi:hypothetical protein